MRAQVQMGRGIHSSKDSAGRIQFSNEPRHVHSGVCWKRKGHIKKVYSNQYYSHSATPPQYHEHY